MRRLFAILLLAFLPLQFSWAAVAGYCGHESGAQALHLGHHQHDHQHVEQTDAKKSDMPSTGGATTGSDFDCGHCHSTGCALLALAASPPATAVASHPVAPVEGSLLTREQTPPDRPQWRRFA